MSRHLKISPYLRGLALSGSISPLSLVLPGFFAGQLAAYYCESFYSALPVVLLVLLFSLAGQGHLALLRQCILWGLAGFLSMCFASAVRPGMQLSDSTTYLAEVDKPPRYKQEGQIELSLSIKAKLENGLPGTIPVPARVLCKAVHLPWKNIARAEEGHTYLIRGRFHQIEKAINPFEYDAQLYRRGYSHTCRLRYATQMLSSSQGRIARWRDGLFALVKNVLGDNETSGLVLSMSLGARDTLTRETEQAFKRTGLAHLLVFSGYQVMLMYYFLRFICRMIFRLLYFCSARACCELSRRVSLSLVFSLFAMAGALLLVLLSGVDGSSMRAALAILLVVLSSTLERGGGLYNSICVSALVLNVIWPCAFLEPGVQLTYAALLGILSGTTTDGETSRLMSYLRICFFVWLYTSCVLLCWFGTFSLLAVPVNALFAPIASLVGCNAVYAALVALWTGIDPQGELLQASAYLLCLFRDLIRSIATLRYASIELEGLARFYSAGALAICALYLTRLAHPHLAQRVKYADHRK